MIATSKPGATEAEKHDYWSMVIHNNVKKIVNLTEFDSELETEESKDFYFPTEKTPKKVYRNGSSTIIIELVPDTSDISSSISKRKLNIK